MRDPARIDSVLAAVKAAWEANPDLRLGQLVYNAAGAIRYVPPCPGLFYLEDADLVAGLPAPTSLPSRRGVGSATNHQES